MKLLTTGLLMLLAAGELDVATAQLQLLPDKQAQCVFAGDARTISVVWQNNGGKTAEAEIHVRIFQTTTTTAVLLGEMPWKKLQVLAWQTVLESARLNFPPVNAKTKFLLQWLAGTNGILGMTEVLAYPTNLLDELKPLAAGTKTGIFDPQTQLQPLLKNAGIDLMDLQNSNFENFSGKLAIIGMFAPKTRSREDLTRQVKSLAKKNVAVVWIQPPLKREENLSPSFYCIPQGTNAVVIAQSDLVSNLPENPQSQLNLVCLCKLALNPVPLSLPDPPVQP